MSSAKFLTVAAVLFTAVACSEDTQSKGEALFEELDPPSPNKLRGVYNSTAEVSSAETVEIRLRFTDDVLLGASKCIKHNAPQVIATGETDLSTGGLDAATGKLTVQELVMKKDFCEGGLPAGTYNFKVEEDKLTLWVEGSLNERTYKKIGD